jgi:hypothetical protein
MAKMKSKSKVKGKKKAKPMRGGKDNEKKENPFLKALKGG